MTVWIGVLVGLVDRRLIIGTKTTGASSCAPRICAETWDMMLDEDHKSYQESTYHGHEDVVGCPLNLHGYISARVERVHPKHFWGEPNSIQANPSHLGSEDSNYDGGTDRADPWLDVRVVADGIVIWEYQFPHNKKYVEPSAEWVGFWRLISEVGDRFTSDGIILDL